MNVSYRWLRAVAPGIDLAPDALAARLAALGFPVEQMTLRGSELADIVVARVVEAGRHPNADRLSLCKVDAGSGELLDVVCGAPNVRAGGLYPFIPVGATLPGGMQIRKAKIRGETSNGMLCSARELGLGTDHSGILELGGDHAPGTSFLAAVALEGELMLDVEVTANRGDLLSHVGLAREVAPAGQDGLVHEPVPGAPSLDGLSWREGTDEVALDGITVRIGEPDLCTRFTGAVVRGVKVGPSPDWLQARLRSIGARPINNVVDATNWVLFELGQPTHAYDLGRLRGGVIQARRAAEGETVTTLDDERRTLSADMLVIADAERTVDVAGIMGDLDTSVTEATTDLFIECAAFEPRSIRRTKKALGIASDAGYRFERWVDPTGQRRALMRVLELVLATAGGRPDPVLADACPRPWTPPVLTLRLTRIATVLGVAFDADAVTALLGPLGFGVVQGGSADELAVTVPGWRGYDVTREIDLIEEIARRHGFDRFPETAGPYRANTVPDHPLFALEDDLRAMLAARGLFEAQTPAFVPEAEGEIRLNNPLSSEEPVLRRTLVPSLLRRLERNLARGVRDVRLFELGTSFRARGPGEAPLESTHLALVLTGSAAPLHWSAGEARALDVWDVKGLAEALAARVHPGAGVGPAASDGPPSEVAHPAVRWRDGLALSVTHEGREVGRAGVIDARSLDLPPWAGDVLALELVLPAEPAPQASPRHRALPAHPAVERDLALLVPMGVEAERVRTVAEGAGGELLEALRPFDLYEGKGLPEGVRSLAWRFRFRAPDRTLTDDEVDRAMGRITAALRDELGIDVRG